MNKLDMCRICLAEDLRLQVVINTHLQEIFQSLTLLPFVTQDNRPLQACFFCCAKLQKCYELRKSILHSEQLFTQMLSNVLVPPELGGIFHKNRLKITPVVDLSLGIEYSKRDNEVKKSSQEMNVTTLNVEVPEVFEYDPLGNDSLQEQLCLDIVKKEEDDNKASEEPPDASPLPKDVKPSYIHTEEGISEELVTSDIKIEVSSNTPTLQTDSEDSTNNLEELNRTATSKDDLDLLIVKKEVELAETSVHAAKRLRPRMLRNPEHLPSYLLQRNEYIEVTIEELYHNDKKTPSTNKNATKKKRLSNYDKVNLYHTPSVADDHKKAKPVRKISLQKSGNSSSRSEGKRYTCETCHKYFFQQRHLNTHIRTHTGENPYQCNVCTKSYGCESNLMQHIRTHTNEKPFKCVSCGKCFRTRSVLTNHIRTHTGERPYVCDICKKSFIQRTQLITHIRGHTGDKRHKCTVCSKVFINQYVLSKHVRTHTGEKPYQCDVCQKSFCQRSALVTHIRAHAGKKPYSCTVCCKGFTKKSLVVRHIQSH